MAVEKLGQIIQQKRKEYDLTQAELATQMGVSKSSVSKWESGQTFPDIFLLPELATYFNLSVDALLNYQPQLTQEQIRHYYQQFSTDFITLSLPAVLEECRLMIKKYYACLPFLLQMSVLLLNHVSLATTKEEQDQVLGDILKLVKRVKTESEDPQEISQANVIEALILLQAEKYETVINNLGRTVQPYLAENQLLAGAYAGLGQFDESRKILQVSTFQSVLDLISTNGKMLAHYQTDVEKFGEIGKRTRSIIDIYHVEQFHPYITLTFYLEECLGHATQGRSEAALKTLHEVVRILEGITYPLSLKGDAYFDLVGSWVNTQLALGESLPGSEELVKENILMFFSQQKPFITLFRDNAEFASLQTRLIKSLH